MPSATENRTVKSQDSLAPEEQPHAERMLNQHRRQGRLSQIQNVGSPSGKRPNVATSGATKLGSPPSQIKALASAAKNPASAVKNAATLAFSMFRQIEPTKDWPFLFILIPMAFLKDIFDIAFAAIPGVGIVVSFITTVLLTILTIVCIILIGERLQTRGNAKYIGGLAVEFVSEALPGIGWLPLFTIETIMIYFFVLFDRAWSNSTSGEESKQTT